MTCHSRAGQMFIDAQYQPHSSSVRVIALAAMSPATPIHLALPPHSCGGREQQLLSGALMGNAKRSPCAFTQSNKRAAMLLFNLFFCCFSHFRHLAWTKVHHPCHLPLATATAPLPLVMWKQPFSCGNFPSFHPDA